MAKQSKKGRKELPAAVARRRRPGSPEAPEPGYTRNQWFAGGIAVAFTLSAILICFVGLPPTGPQISPDQTARVRIIAEFPFTYESRILTERRREELRQRIPPVYRIDMEPFARFREYLVGLQEAAAAFVDDPRLWQSDEEVPPFTPEEVVQVLREYDPDNTYNLSSNDLLTILNELSPERRANLFREGLAILETLYREGIIHPDEMELRTEESRLRFFNLHRESGHVSEVEALTHEEALRGLRINLSALAVPRSVSIAMFRVLRNGLKPNLVFDREETDRAIARAIEGVTPVTVTVREGDSIIEPGMRVTSLQLEQLNAYREDLQEARDTGIRGVNPLLFEQAALTLCLALIALLFVRIHNGSLHRHVRTLAVSALVLLVNLALIRLALEAAGETWGERTWTASVALPWVAPVALGPIVLAILVGSGPGILAAALIGVMNALMQGSSIGILLISVLSGVAGIYATRGIQLRTRVVRAGIISGGFMAIGAVVIGLRDTLELTTMGLQALAALGTGALTGVIVIGILPVMEQLFRYTTNITLLELTDFNHPLLRKMQLTAPGSYHHSLMVANLSENAAAATGANPLVCRVCSLFHDIGKMVKPEYYSENQRDDYNPHIERNPSMSALIIKAHVKEGIVLARQYKLPRIIRDVIREHHGTTLIQYFYYKAIEKQRKETPPVFPNAPSVELDKVNEDTYRYEGPKPRSLESAIIALADSVEAASRSLRKINLQSIEELVDGIFQARVEDAQLSEAPITLEELETIKQSFKFSLLNMLHARTEYPGNRGREGKLPGDPDPSGVSNSEAATPHEPPQSEPGAAKAPEPLQTEPGKSDSGPR